MRNSLTEKTATPDGHCPGCKKKVGFWNHIVKLPGMEFKCRNCQAIIRESMSKYAMVLLGVAALTIILAIAAFVLQLVMVGVLALLFLVIAFYYFRALFSVFVKDRRSRTQ
jgi:prepilin signal peptidase PulO-like enzyme (type II secretory pathway)